MLRGNEMYTSRSTKITEGLLNLFLIGWFIYGNYLIFSIYFPAEEAPMDFPQKWCNSRLYTFCLIHIFVIYALVAVFALVVFCGTCCFRIGLAQIWM